MDNLETQITPEMYAQMMGQQGNGQPQPQEQQPMQQQPMQQQPMQQQPMQQQPQMTQDQEVAQAKAMLGLDVQAEQMAKMQETLAKMQQQNVQLEMSKKYPSIPFELVEKEIQKVEAINPSFANAMRTTTDGMDMAYRATMANITPKETPDNLTDGSGNPDSEEDIVNVIKSGKGNDFQLGNYILSKK